MAPTLYTYEHYLNFVRHCVSPALSVNPCDR